jgi:hypothetical protein
MISSRFTILWALVLVVQGMHLLERNGDYQRNHDKPTMAMGEEKSVPSDAYD